MSGFDPLGDRPLGAPADAAATLTVTATPGPNATKGALYSFQATATGGTGPYTWTAAGLPPGVSVDSASGLVSGYPTTAGTYGPALIRATDSLGVVGDLVPQPAIPVAGDKALPAPLISKETPGPYNFRLRSKVAFGGPASTSLVRASWAGGEVLYAVNAFARVSWAAGEILHSGDVARFGRVSWSGLEVLRSTASGVTNAQVTWAGVEVLYIYGLVRSTWSGLEVSHSGPAASARASWAGVEVMHDDPSSARATWAGIEVLRSVANAPDSGFVYLIAS